MKTLTVFLVLSALAPAVVADLPVHCLRHQVAGDWEFTLSPLGPSRSTCGHKRPDSPTTQPPLDFLASLGNTRNLRVSLQDPATASAEDGTTGTWTMIYDEGFEVALGDQVFFAFSRFEFVPDASGKRTNISHCDETQVGWYHDTARRSWGCYHGKKVGSGSASAAAQATATVAQAATATEGTPVAATSDNAAPVADVPAAAPAPAAPASAPASSMLAQSVQRSRAGWSSSDRSGFLAPEPASQDKPEEGPEANQDDASPAEETSQSQEAADQTQDATSQAEDSNEQQSDSSVQGVDLFDTPSTYTPWVPGSAGFDRPMPTTWQESVASALNFLQLGWTASAYDMFQGKTPRELNRLAGVRRQRPPHRAGASAAASLPSAAASGFSSFLGLNSKLRKASDEQNFDWRNQHGHNWLEPVVTQGDCGSCYTISTVHMLTARNRIRQNDLSQPSFSVSFPLYCSEYNQGCDGGYGFLQSKWSEDVGLVPAHCAPFSQGGGSCQVTSDCDLGDRRYRAVNHHYVGGFYGASDEDLIKQELISNGPLVMSFEPKEDFMYYKNGIYRSGPNKIHQEWEQVDHAVLLIGFGEENGQAYWTLQNSWGSDWGEAGYFRMARGTDESGCESIAVAADVAVEGSNTVLDDFLGGL